MHDLLLRSASKEGGRRRFSYNLVLTTTWFMLIPRSNADVHLGEGVSPLSVNSMAFAGCVLVKDDMQLRTLQEKGTEGTLERLATACFTPAERHEPATETDVP
jgi:ATP adenylyltransferase/5',5'''-P-1,P-4-tetraphosphate phosphorylase II